MKMCYEEALVMPSSYAGLNEEEMSYIEGGFEYSKSFSYRAPVAYSTFVKAGDEATKLANRFVGVWSNDTLVKIPAGAKLTSAIYLQWASAFYGAAFKIRRYKDDNSKIAKGNIKITGQNSYMTINVKIV